MRRRAHDLPATVPARWATPNRAGPARETVCRDSSCTRRAARTRCRPPCSRCRTRPVASSRLASSARKLALIHPCAQPRLLCSSCSRDALKGTSRKTPDSPFPAKRTRTISAVFVAKRELQSCNAASAVYAAAAFAHNRAQVTVATGQMSDDRDQFHASAPLRALYARELASLASIVAGVYGNYGLLMRPH